MGRRRHRPAVQAPGRTWCRSDRLFKRRERPRRQDPLAPGYQVGFAERVRGEASIRTGAVGLIEHPQQAEGILADGAADAIFLGRAMLREPHWALLAANTLGVELDWPAQYARAKPHS